MLQGAEELLFRVLGLGCKVQRKLYHSKKDTIQHYLRNLGYPRKCYSARTVNPHNTSRI